MLSKLICIDNGTIQLSYSQGKPSNPNHYKASQNYLNLIENRI